jgi:hypothetical protein
MTRVLDSWRHFDQGRLAQQRADCWRPGASPGYSHPFQVGRRVLTSARAESRLSSKPSIKRSMRQKSMSPAQSQQLLRSSPPILAQPKAPLGQTTIPRCRCSILPGDDDAPCPTWAKRRTPRPSKRCSPDPRFGEDGHSARWPAPRQRATPIQAKASASVAPAVTSISAAPRGGNAQATKKPSRDPTNAASSKMPAQRG